MIIRHAENSDREAWLKLRCLLWPEGTSDEHGGEIDSFFAGTAREPQAVLLAERDGEIVGFAELSIRNYAEGCDSDRIAFLEGWYVAPQARRLGIGKALVAAAEQWGIEQGCTEFASDTQADNDVSRAAHDNCGFTEVAVIRCFRKELPKPPVRASEVVNRVIEDRFEIGDRGTAVVIGQVTDLPVGRPLRATVVRPDGSQVVAEAFKESVLRRDPAPLDTEAFLLRGVSRSEVPEGSTITIERS